MFFLRYVPLDSWIEVLTFLLKLSTYVQKTLPSKVWNWFSKKHFSEYFSASSFGHVEILFDNLINFFAEFHSFFSQNPRHVEKLITCWKENFGYFFHWSRRVQFREECRKVFCHLWKKFHSKSENDRRKYKIWVLFKKTQSAYLDTKNTFLMILPHHLSENWVIFAQRLKMGRKMIIFFKINLSVKIFTSSRRLQFWQ